MERFAGKVAVVTGASAGIGAAIAESLVEEGLQVVGLARRHEQVEELSRKLSDKKGKLHAIQADMTIEEDILQAFKWIETNLGPIHILINNAGTGRESTLISGDTKVWQDTLSLNILGLCIATREALKSMMDNNIDGHIVHINSLTGQKFVFLPSGNVYGATKQAVSNLAEQLRMELVQAGSKIKITSVSPGLVDTSLIRQSSKPERIDMMQSAPKLQPKDVASAVLYTLGTPDHVQVHEITIRPVGEQF